MLDSVKRCSSSKLRRARMSLEKLINFSRKLSSCKKEASKSWKLASDLNWLASSFAAMETSSQLKQVFKLIDTNGDGKISPLELKQVLVSLGHEKAEAAEEAEGIVREMDCDGDGFVDLDEFMIVMGSSDESEDLENGISGESVIMAAFKVFDADGNGLISAKELKSVLARLGCGNCSAKQCRKMIKGVDRDGDGFVNFEEFKLMMTAGY
ncbi:hypothetical protein C2S53_012169 [Perilla frutescens var. hirtella]|uniref:EF-hand domain-containing protein n=1 Tax=Perilla frutescens var. hirtella TaxID=608512 RepID=A0AAD4P7P5_PERFH|nr:hypothetical protein C2S53_012169 [Perilla frutescens var. hirtella]